MIENDNVSNKKDSLSRPNTKNMSKNLRNSKLNHEVFGLLLGINY